ncbi:hypothetical protein V8G54_012698 [Vigna mungo]|uniref:(+)-neomenthol dehydrogenase n=1 Tax=Vigna mungo TaxID=3915 RepID=A0AAQ3NU89_VIGMU
MCLQVCGGWWNVGIPRAMCPLLRMERNVIAPSRHVFAEASRRSRHYSRWRKSRRVRRFGLYLCYPNPLSFLFKTKCPKALRYAVVTGENKGIGFAICKQLASNGFTVVFTARDEKRGVEAVEKLKELGLPSHVVFHQLDVTDPICSV